MIMVSDRATRTQATVTVDGLTATAEVGTTLFDFAESLGITVPTSCYKQGKCRECLLEIESGSELLSPLAPQESHLGGKFRLACRTSLTAPGEVHCHTLRRDTLRIETETTGLDLQNHLDPAVTRDGSRILLDGKQLVLVGFQLRNHLEADSTHATRQKKPREPPTTPGVNQAV